MQNYGKKKDRHVGLQLGVIFLAILERFLVCSSMNGGKVLQMFEDDVDMDVEDLKEVWFPSLS